VYRRLRGASAEAGFTLIEVASAVTLLGILLAIAVGPYANYNRAQQHAGSTRTVVAALRSAQAASVSENATYRADFTADTVLVYRRDPVTHAYSLVKTSEVGEHTIQLSGASFTASDGTVSSSAYFYPRGSGSKGSLTVGREGSTKTYTIRVEGLTARVSYE
jgi:prepilin-type N-terminal cleavage/methylation domain-containing protein